MRQYETMDAISLPAGWVLGAATSVGLIFLAQSAVGQMVFEPAGAYPTIGTCTSVVSADMNGDLIPDIINCSAVGDVEILLGDGNGGYQRSQDIYVYGTRPVGLIAARLNHDQSIDLAWADSEGAGVYIWLSRGDGVHGRLRHVAGEGLPTTVRDMQPADIDGDGDHDLVLISRFGWNEQTTRVCVLRNDGNRFTLSQTIDLTDNSGGGLTLGDIDRDGDPDIAAINSQVALGGYYSWAYFVDHAELAVLMNDGNGVFSAPVVTQLPAMSDTDLFPDAVASGDLDGDGDIDFCVLYEGTYPQYDDPYGRILTVENTQDGQMLIPHSPVININYGWGGYKVGGGGVAVADLDCDGLADIAATSYAGDFGMTLLRNRGNFEFDPPEGLITWYPYTLFLTLSDLNSDGQFDIIGAGEVGLVLLNNATAISVPPFSHTTLQRGQPATFTVSSLNPGDTAYFAYSTSGLGSSTGIGQLGGLTLDLAGHITLIGSASADNNGVVTLNVNIPPDAPLATLALQAAVRRGPQGADSVKTRFAVDRVMP